MKEIKIFIIAGDPSGDLYGEKLAKAILRQTENSVIMGFSMKEDKDFNKVSLYGLGGYRMKSAKVKLIGTLVDVSVVGFSEVFEHISVLKSIYRRLESFFVQNRPDVVVLIDYPGFNLKVADLCHKLGIPVVYYVSPQIWAWWFSRIKKIKKLIKKVLVILSFEEEIYKKADISVDFVGHPLLDIIFPTKTREETFDYLKLDKNFPVVGLLPGSRKGEVIKHLSIMLEIAEKIKEKNSGVQFVLPIPVNLSTDFIRGIASSCNNKVDFKIIRDPHYNARSIMDACIVASGSATVENACLGLPMVVIYKVSSLSYFIAKLLVKIPNIALVNILAKKTIVPEFVQGKINTDVISGIITDWLHNPEKRQEVVELLKKVKDGLGERGASNKAAKIILDMAKGIGHKGM